MSRTLFLLLLTSTISYAQVYKWVDENGNIHFSDMPHQGASALVVDAQKPTAAGAESRAEEIHQRIKTTNDWLSEKRKKEEHLRRKEQRRIDKKNQKDQKRCQSLKDKISQNEFHWDLTKTQGYKQSQKDAYLIKKEKYHSEFNQYCR
jgi:disulfide oxidoreductase YuzD